MKNFYCGLYTAGSVSKLVVVDPASGNIYRSANYNSAPLDAAKASIVADLTATYGSNAVVGDMVSVFAGATDATEALFVLSTTGTTSDDTSFTSVARVIAIQGNSYTVLASFEGVTPKYETFVVPPTLFAFDSRSFLLGVYSGSATFDILTMDISGLAQVAHWGFTTGVPASRMFVRSESGTAYYFFRDINNDANIAYLLKNDGSQWITVTSQDSPGSMVVPSVPYAMAQADGGAIDYVVGFTYTDLNGPQAKDSTGSYRDYGATVGNLSNLDNGALIDFSPSLSALMGGEPTLVEATFTPLPEPEFWVNLVGAAISPT